MGFGKSNLDNGEKDLLSGVFITNEILPFFKDETRMEEVHYEMDDFLDEIYDQVKLIYDSLKIPELEKKLGLYHQVAERVEKYDPEYAEKLRMYVVEKRKENLLTNPKE